MKNAFDGSSSRNNMDKEIIKELENMSVETFKTEKQREGVFPRNKQTKPVLLPYNPNLLGESGCLSSPFYHMTPTSLFPLASFDLVSFSRAGMEGRTSKQNNQTSFDLSNYPSHLPSCFLPSFNC